MDSAKYEEYVKAGQWLDILAERVGCSRLDIQMVPGNHDIDRDAITPVGTDVGSDPDFS